MPQYNNNDIFDVNLDDFDSRVIQASFQQPLLVDFWADWCRPCIVIAPVLEKIINHYDGALKLAKLEVDEGKNMKLAGQYQVRGFPTIILFHNGKERGRFSSAQTFQFINHFIQQYSNL